ncbi:MAG: TlpA family protein disulfide reductase [Flavobacteriaceae bacterium]
MNKILLFLLFGLLVSCESSKKQRSGIFLGGQIVNPSSRTVTLYQGANVVETLELDENLRFNKQFDSLPSGIYKLEHLPEYQTLLMEENDSILVRINATAFDESIVFSGTGASKNNFLVELHLKQEAENRFLSSKYSSSKKEFKELIDSLLMEKKTMWIQMDSLNSLSPIAQKVTQAAYIYPYANIRERYALLRGTQWTTEEDSLFFNFRRYLNYGDTDLAFFDPYVNYLLNFISQKALQSGESYFQVRQTTDFNIRRLEVLDKEIKGKLLRNSLARVIAVEEILTFENHDQHELFLQYYSTVNSSPAYFAEVLTLHSDISKMEAGKPLPKVQLQNSKRATVNSAALANGSPTVLYFWSQTQMNHYRNTLERVKQLQIKHPSIRFIGICIQPFNAMVDQVQKMMEVEPENQYALIDFEKASKAWVLTLLNKAIIIDPKGNVVEGFGNFSEGAFEKLLQKL